MTSLESALNLTNHISDKFNIENKLNELEAEMKKELDKLNGIDLTKLFNSINGSLDLVKQQVDTFMQAINSSQFKSEPLSLIPGYWQIFVKLYDYM